MSTTTLTFRLVDLTTGAAVDPDGNSVLLSDPAGTYGVERTDTNGVVVADGTAMTRVSAGVYTYAVTDPALGLTYRWYAEYAIGGVTRHDLFATPGTPETNYAGRYTTQAAVRTWLGTINADAMADLDGDDAPDAGAYSQSIQWGEDELDLYAGGGPGEVPFTYTGGTTGQQAVAQRTIQRWATVLSGWFLAYKRPAVQGSLLTTPAAAQALATLDGAKRAVLEEIKQWRAGGLLLPGLTPATEAEDTPEPGQFQFVTIDRGNGCNGDENSSCW